MAKTVYFGFHGDSSYKIANMSKCNNKNKAVLFDFDGVINRNNNVNNKIARLSVDYLRKELNISEKKAESLNRIYYPALGHTCKAIDYIKNGSQKITTESLQRYNNFVFEKLNYNEILNMFYQEDISQMNQMFSKIQLLQTISTVYIFTNAPLIWCNKIINNFGYNNIIKEENIITSDKIGMVKPNEQAYCSVQSEYLEDYNMKFFIDDSYKNLIIPQKILQWKGIYFSDHNNVMSEQGYNNILVSKNIEDIYNYINYYTSDLEF